MQEHLSSFIYQAAFRVGYNEADGIFLRIALHQIGFQPESRFAGAGTTDDKYVFISCSLRVFRSVVHGKTFRLGEDDIVPKIIIHIRCDIIRLTPSCRAVFFISAVFLHVFGFTVNDQSEDYGNDNTHAEVKRVKAGHGRFESQKEAFAEVENLFAQFHTRCKPPHLTEFCGKQADKKVRDVHDDRLFQVFHRVCPRCLVFVISSTLF